MVHLVSAKQHSLLSFGHTRGPLSPSSVLVIGNVSGSPARICFCGSVMVTSILVSAASLQSSTNSEDAKLEIGDPRAFIAPLSSYVKALSKQISFNDLQEFHLMTRQISLYDRLITFNDRTHTHIPPTSATLIAA